MTNEGEQSITCTACDRQYRWKQELAGRKMKCKCGEVVVMPNQPDDIDDLYTMAGLESSASPQKTNCDSCGTRIKPGAAICINCGYNLKTGDVVVTAINAPATGQGAPAPAQAVGGIYANAMASRKKHTDINSRSDSKMQKQKNVFIPLGLIASSLVVVFAYQMFFADDILSPLQAVTYISLSTAVIIPILLIGLYIASSVIGISYGPLHTGLLKLLAIYLAPEACQSIINIIMGDYTLLGWFVSLIIYYALTMYLFELDPDETFYTIIILTITKIIASIFLVTVIFAIAMSL